MAAPTRPKSTTSHADADELIAPAAQRPRAAHRPTARGGATTANETATATDRKDALGRSTTDDEAGASGVLAAVWCRSVGTFWTLELHQLDDGGPGRGRVVDWVSSGVPISQPQPDALTRELLAERGLALFGDSSVGPCTHNRHGIGYVARDAELIALAHLVADEAAGSGRHPMMLAAQWVAAGFCVDAAAGWIRQGVHSPQAASARRRPRSSLLHRPPPSATVASTVG
jgi:hypothetical protein